MGNENDIACSQGSDVRYIPAFQYNMLEWFLKRGRKFPWRNKHLSNYRRIVAEVLLQRTKAEVVASFFNTFINKYPSWRQLAVAPEEEVGELLKSIGLWRRRARSLTKLAKAMTNLNGRFPATRQEIESLPNVGQYIANAVLLFCHGEPQPLLDVNMARVLERYFGPRKLADIRYDPYLQDLAKRIVTCGDPVSMNWAILDLAATVCRPSKPLCSDCPITDNCNWANNSWIIKRGTIV